MGPTTVPGGRVRNFMPLLDAVGDQVVESEALRDAVHRPHEVLDHAVGLGVVDVEPVQLAVADDVDAGLLLRVDDHARRVDQRLFGGAAATSQSGTG
jgi:hypothetical protein